MKNVFLFPRLFRIIGVVLTALTLVLGIAHHYLNYELPLSIKIKNEASTAPLTNVVHSNNLTDEIAGVGLIIGLLFTAFSKLKIEDEYIAQLRLNALQWAVYINYVLLAVAFIFIYGSLFYEIMIYNLFTVLVIFSLRFYYLVFKNSATADGK